MKTNIERMLEDEEERLAQQRELARVGGRIAPLVLEFARRRLRAGREQFRVSELRAFVESELPTAPGSPDRILRLLQRAGELRYLVLNRRQSLYEIIWAVGA